MPKDRTAKIASRKKKDLDLTSPEDQVVDDEIYEERKSSDYLYKATIHWKHRHPQIIHKIEAYELTEADYYIFYTKNWSEIIGLVMVWTKHPDLESIEIAPESLK